MIRKLNCGSIDYYMTCAIKNPSFTLSSCYRKPIYNMPKFCANLSFMFTEVAFLERYKLAKDAGFRAVESGFPNGLLIEDVVKYKEAARVEQVLLNVFTGDATRGELGFASIPGKEKEFRESLELTIRYAIALKAKKIHIVAGIVEGPVTPAHDEVYESNLRYAVNRLQTSQILGLIEPINKHSKPGYYLNSFQKALSVVKKINSPNLKVMVDIFHLQQICGDITHSINDLMDYCGHIQLAQVPDRHEPDTRGEIDFKYVIGLLDKSSYRDWIGLEYTPLGSTVTGLKWIGDFGYEF